MNTLDRKRIGIFLAFAFGISWLAALVIYLTGGLANSAELIPGTGITFAVVMMAAGYMWGPALANILTRLVTKEGSANLWLRPRLKQGWPYWLIAWVVPAVVVLAGGALYFALFPQQFDSNLTNLAEVMRSAGQPEVTGPMLWTIVVTQTLMAVLIAPLINGLFTFGEEFGWRAYLQQKLLPLGGRAAVLLLGVIWGIWHWPAIAMGHNYGLDYTGFPWLGMLMMVVFTTAAGTFLAWVTLRSGSVWPAVIGHAAINGIAALPALFVQGEPNPLIGPLATGLVGAAGWIIIALVLLSRPDSFVPLPEEERSAPAVVPVE